MKLKGFLAYSIKKLRELREHHRAVCRDKTKDWRDEFDAWTPYYEVLCFVADYYGIDRWRYLERLVLDPEVEV